MTGEAILALLDHPAAERLGWTLLHFLWQGAAVAALLVVTLWLLRRRSPQARYAACGAAMASMALLPLVTFWAIGPTESQAVHARAPRGGGAVYLGPVGGAQAMPEVPTPSDSGAAGAADASFVSRLAAAWAAGVLALALWHAGGWLHLRRRLLLDTRPVEGDLREALDELASSLRVSRPVRLVEAAWVQVPAVVGALRPVLLFPASALTGLTPGQLRALLAHELAHVRRHDYALNLLQTVLQTLLFYHPAVWWVSGRMREEREYCCDDVAAAASGDRVTYARALAAMEELRALPVGLALAARGGSLLRRVQRLLGVAPSPGMTRGRSLVAAALAVAFAALPLAAPRLRAAPASDAPSKPTTRPAAPAAAPTSGPAETAVTPEDLVAEVKDYEIQPNDLVSVEIAELQAPGTQTVKTTRVSQGGTISLPFIGQTKVGGLTEAGAEKTIAKKFLEQNVLQNAQVAVTVTEARGRTFSVIGGAGRPGQYSIVDPDFRLLDAMTTAAIDPKAADLYILRRTGGGEKKPGEAPPQARKIRVPLDRLVAGDLNVNLVIRPGDLIVVEAAAGRTARLVVGPDGVTFEGKRTSWDDLAAAMESVPQAQRGRTRVLISPATTDLTLRQYGQARDRAAALAKQLGFAGTADDAFEGAGPPAPTPAKEGGPRGDGPVAGEPPGPLVPYYIGGHLPQPGGDAVGGRGVTLLQALLAAGVPENSDDVGQVRILRRGVAAPGDQLTVDGAALMKDGKGDLSLQSGDRILVMPKEKAGP